MKCKNCDGDGVIVDVEYGHAGKYGCKYCDGKGVVEPLTEQEYIQTCNTEQLAEVLNKIFMTRTFCHICPEGGVCDIGYECKYSEGKKIEDWELWLKKPYLTSK